MTVLEGIQRSTEFLAKKEVESPRLQAELQLAHVLKLPRMRLYLDFERTLGAAEVDAFRELVRRRGAREPLQYITGSTSFCGLEIAVNSQVLIPRPDTELLAERGWQFLQEVSALNPEPFALDFGTGSGCVAIALAVNCPAARVGALDSSAEALELAQANAARHGVSERVEFINGARPAPIAGRKFHLIISNPPYIPTNEIESLQPEVRDYEPRQALDGGEDGLGFFRRLAEEGGPFLEPAGRLMVEFGDGQVEAVREIFESGKWIVEATQADYTQRPRIAILKRLDQTTDKHR